MTVFTDTILYLQSNDNRWMARFTSLKSSAMVRFTSLKTGVLTAVKCECLPDCRSTLPFQLRWRRLAAAEAGVAAPGAAGMPVRWPRRPAAVSEAVAAGAGPDFSCAGELEQPLKPRIGKMCRPSVGASVARSVARSGLVGRSISRLGVLCLGSSAGTGALDFRGSRDKILGVSDLARVSSSVIGAVRACLLARLLHRVTPLFFPSVPSFVIFLVSARTVIGSAGVVVFVFLYHARRAVCRLAVPP